MQIRGYGADIQLDELMDHFRVLGFESESGKAYRLNSNLPDPKQRYMDMIECICRVMGLPMAYEDVMALKRYKAARVRWARRVNCSI
ncbi:MAG: hypothetical protein QM498_10860 [Desulfobacterium sp.]